MNEAAVGWLVRTVVGGGVLLLAGWLLSRRLRSPARQQRLGQWAVAAALVLAVVSLAPAWLLLPMPQRFATVTLVREPLPQPAINPEPAAADRGEAVPGLAAVEEPILALVPPLPAHAEVDVPAPIPTPAPATAPAVPWWHGWGVVDFALLGYALVALVLLGRWLLGHLAVRWLLRGREPVPEHVARLFAELAGGRSWRLVVSRRAELPFSVGLWRPTVVLPLFFALEADEDELRWVLTHELTHLERHDTRLSWLFSLAGLVYFYLPWFWWLRRQVRLCQEYIADAAAARAAGCRTDYAQFLLDCAGRPPVGATGVSGSHSDLFRRIAMLLKSPTPVEGRCGRPWALAVGAGLLSLAVLAGGLGLKARAEEPAKGEEPDKPAKKEDKKDEKKKDRPARRVPGVVMPDIDELLKQFGGALDDETQKELRQRMDELRKKMDEMMKQLGRPGFPGMPNLPNFPNFPNLPNVRRVPLPLDRPTPQDARLGVQVGQPTQTLIDQLDLPRGQGLVLEEVGPNSAAAKAGLKKHDILLELDGKAVSSKPEELRRLVEGIKPNNPVDAVVLRKGKKETIKGLKLPEKKAEAAEAPAFPGLPGVPGGRVLPGLLGRGKVTSITRNGDEFTAKQQSGGVTLIVKGKVDQGKPTVNEIIVNANGQQNTYDSLDKVPAEYRDQARKLAEAAGGRGVRVPEAKANDIF